MNGTNTHKWLVLYLRPRTEKKTAGLLAARKAPVNLPLRREVKIYQRRRVNISKPVFPGYLFAALNEEQRSSLYKTGNLLRVMTPENEQVMLYELDQIQKALAVDPTLQRRSAMTMGRQVRITTGPFMGIEGKVERLKSNTHVILNVEMIGQAIEVEVEKNFVEIID